ncbi:cyanobacterial porin [[Leptolyngbya] sp. PCC 7376]|uniref:iron uptake porin n=1 Tax=[Leptolyngbya] sp. PCC 7376 TaxID=111781 RepID=UPI00029EEF1C|nr:iron uptake porin [[Leptolyngbya] sp. PCC 7376]AFY38272.1 cyanobacterial porin [[Leptolyngbya] sp. PCC 7376]
MTKFWKSLSIAGAALSVTVAGAAQAAPNNSAILDQLNNYSQEGRTDVAQVNSVFQLRDVAPSDWAFDALRNLVEKYNCIVGYPDGTFRGNRPLSRYEFAAGLNACMQQIERLIVGGGTDVDAADITRLRALVQEFEAELATLGARVDDIEGRVEFLEDNQFSTTTKLNGEVVFGISDSFGDTDLTDGSDDDDSQTVFNNRVRLQLETSFTGKDTLITRLTAGNATSTVIGAGGVGRFTYDNALADNDVIVDWLAYYFPLKRANAYVAAVGGLQSDYVSTTFGANGLEDYTGASGSLTFNAASSPIYLIGGGAGFGLNFPAGPVDISLGYLADDHASPAEGDGLFNGQYGALAQVAFNLGSRAELGVTYVNSYQEAGSAFFDFGGGSAFAGTVGANGLGTSEANTFGVQGKFDITEKVSLAAYGLYSDVDLVAGGDEEIWSYGAGVAFNDMGKEGNVLGIFAGVPPYVGGSAGGGDDTPVQVEGFYKYQLNDSISITPGVIWLNNATETDTVDSALIGTVRTTFKF